MLKRIMLAGALLFPAVAFANDGIPADEYYCFNPDFCVYPVEMEAEGGNHMYLIRAQNKDGMAVINCDEHVLKLVLRGWSGRDMLHVPVAMPERGKATAGSIMYAIACDPS